MGKGCPWQREQPVHRQRDAEGHGELKTPDMKYSKWSIGHVEGQAKAQAGEAGRA